MTSAASPIRFLLYPSLGEVREHVKVDLFGRALSERLGRPVVVELAPTYEVLEEELAAGRVDLAWGTAEQCTAFEPRARAVLRAVRSGSWHYYSALVCRAEEPLTLETLAGKRMAWVAPRSTGGHLLPVRHLEARGVYPEEVFSEQRFHGTYRKALEAVLSGEADVTALFSNHADERSLRASLVSYVGADERRLHPFLFTEPTLSDGLILTRRMSEADADALVSVLTEMRTDGAGLEMLLGPFRVEGFVQVPAGQLRPVHPRPGRSAEYLVAELDGEDRCRRLWAPTGRAFGREVRGAEGRTLSEVLGPEAGEPLLALVRAVRYGGAEGRLEYRLRVEGQTRIYAAEVTPCAPGPAGHEGGLGLMVRDVTELRALEDPLYRLASFPLLHPDPLLELSMEGELRYANPATNTAFPDLLVRGPAHPLVEAALGWAWRGAAAGEPPPTVHHEGRYWELTVAQLWDPPGVRVFARDVTLRKQMEAQLLHSDRLAAVGSLAASVGHEMNNPLAFVLANLSFAREELEQLGEELREQHGPRADRLADVLEALSETAEGANRLKHIVQDLRALSRKPPENQTRVEVQPVLENALKLLRGELRQRARVERDFHPMPEVDGDEARLSQLFLNLLLNAVQAMSEGDASHNVLRVAAYTGPEGEAVVEVQDTGRGIPKEVLERLFEPFVTTRNTSVGMGLSVSHAIVTSLGGTLKVQSRQGWGTTFTITLPPASEPSQQSPGKDASMLCG